MNSGKKQKGTLANLPKDIFRKTTVKVSMEDTTSHTQKLSLVRESSISHDTDFRALLPGPDLWLCHLLAMKSWAVFLNYLCFSFPICKMEIMTPWLSPLYRFVEGSKEFPDAKVFWILIEPSGEFY